MKGLVRVAERAGALAGQRVDIGSGELVEVREVVERVYRLVSPAVPHSWVLFPIAPTRRSGAQTWWPPGASWIGCRRFRWTRVSLG
jgi:hypothetical protein